MSSLFALVLAAAAPPAEIDPADLRSDAAAIERIVDENYAYPERLAGGRYSFTRKLRAEAGTISTKRELVRFAERAVALLADHHAITGASMKDSWAVFPSYGDLWIETRGGDFVIEQVRTSSPAARAGIRPGDRLVRIGTKPAAAAVAEFWSGLGAAGGGKRDAFAARILASGRRDAPRALTIADRAGKTRQVTLDSLYSLPRPDRQPVSVSESGGALILRLNDSLGDDATIPAFDAAMARARPGQAVVIDLTDTPGGGNTTVARAMLGWFVARPSAYQVHRLPAEERRTGVARQWIEQVLPRPRKYHRGPVTVRVGRWTGSMGEGLAIGFDALGASVVGTRMAGLLGAIYDYPLPKSGIVVKLPTERLYAVDGTPREDFVPKVARPAATPF